MTLKTQFIEHFPAVLADAVDVDSAIWSLPSDANLGSLPTGFDILSLAYDNSYYALLPPMISYIPCKTNLTLPYSNSLQDYSYVMKELDSSILERLQNVHIESGMTKEHIVAAVTSFTIKDPAIHITNNDPEELGLLRYDFTNIEDSHGYLFEDFNIAYLPVDEAETVHNATIPIIVALNTISPTRTFPLPWLYNVPQSLFLEEVGNKFIMVMEYENSINQEDCLEFLNQWEDSFYDLFPVGQRQFNTNCVSGWGSHVRAEIDEDVLLPINMLDGDGDDELV
ncbi:hypothetical protein P9112_012662 [Eukaryota sp. TZLM1-RC]